MSFLSPISVVLGTQLYWLSLLSFGYVGALSFYRLRKKPMPSWWTDAPWFGKLSLSFMTVCVIFCIWSLIGYGLHLPAWWLGASYIGTAGLSLFAATTILREQVLNDTRSMLKSCSQLKLFSPVSLMIAVVVLDYLLNLHYGAYLGGDGFVHMAKARALASNGFSLADPSYGDVMQSGYLVTVWHTLLAVPTYFGFNIIDSWFYSLAIAKLTIISSLFYLSWFLLRLTGVSRAASSDLACFVAVITISLPFNVNTAMAAYPNRIVVAWLSLLVCGLIILFKKRSPVILLSASLLVGMTHPLYSTMGFLLLCTTGFTFLVLGRSYIDKKITTSYIAALFMLAAPALLDKLVIRGVTKSFELAAYTKGYSFWHIFGVGAFSPSAVGYFTATNYRILAIIGLAGYLGIMYKLRDKIGRLVIGSLLLFVPLFAFEPLGFEFLHQFIPYWAINRIYDVNALSALSVAFGCVMVGLIITQRRTSLRKYLPWSLATVFVIIAVSFGTVSVNSHNTLYGLPTSKATKIFHYQTKGSYQSVAGLQSLLKDLPKDSVVLTDLANGLTIPAIAPVHILAGPAANTNPLVDITNRLACRKLILQGLSSPKHSADLMKQSGVDYILFLNKSSGNKQLLADPDHFELVNKDARLSVFKLLESNTRPANVPVCRFSE